ncbi:MAG: hypothetical protein M0Z77_09070 [Thermoplasmatales archaeon]|jgi:DNA-3-methyladenine glycosylase II|nr:hypothetical protein [Thermoplasmatales archaeon]
MSLIFTARQSRLTFWESGPVTLLSDAQRHLSSVDKVLAEIIPLVGECRVKLNNNAWEALFLAVVYQQLNGALAKRIIDRIRGHLNGAIPSPQDLLSWPDNWLVQTGLNSRKKVTLLTVADQIEKGKLDLGSFNSLSDDRVIEKLTSIWGIGTWTASMFLVFHLGRSDVIIPGDLGIRKAIRFNYALSRFPTESEVEKISSAWSPFRTMGSWYLWKSLPGFPEPGLN